MLGEGSSHQPPAVSMWLTAVGPSSVGNWWPARLVFGSVSGKGHRVHPPSGAPKLQTWGESTPEGVRPQSGPRTGPKAVVPHGGLGLRDPQPWTMPFAPSAPPARMVWGTGLALARTVPRRRVPKHASLVLRDQCPKQMRNVIKLTTSSSRIEGVSLVFRCNFRCTKYATRALNEARYLESFRLTCLLSQCLRHV